MYANLHAWPEMASWHANTEQRLAVSLLLATLLVGGALSLVHLPLISDIPPLTHLIVEIIRSEPTSRTKPEETSRPEPLPATPDVPVETAVKTEQPPADVSEQTVDWMSMIGPVSKEIVENPPKEYSVNPGFDEKRRIAAEKYRPSRAPVKRPIWENVEKDQLGRTLLWNGDCYRVLDDPSVANRYAFETFDQYMVYCIFRKRKGRELPWVQEIRDKLKLDVYETDQVKKGMEKGRSTLFHPLF